MLGPEPQPSRFLSRRLFLFTLALVYLAAFLSLAVQIRGLAGEQGILPARGFLAAVESRVGIERFWLLPTLCWWIGAGDPALVALTLGGAVLSVVLLLGVASPAVLALLWLAYLSLVSVGGEFLRFQWDFLLLECGFLAIFLAPLSSGGRRAPGPPPSPVVIWLFRFLLFRLMFASGAVKLLSGDPTWADLGALAVHYETQPLPTPLGWIAHQMPPLVHRASAIVLFAVELGGPWLLFGPPRARRVAVVAFTGLQLLIAATGNYGFFNLLTIGIGVLALDDEQLPRVFRARVRRVLPAARAGRAWPRPAIVLVAGLVGFLGAAELSRLGGLRDAWPGPVRAAVAAAAPFAIVNGYGLFAVMTTTRPEIVVEGSRDGRVWEPYAFRWKPGDPERRPSFVAPHMPRLDWQMWFAALAPVERSPWFARFLDRLLERRPEVVALLAGDPFEGRPPRFVRAQLFRYRFTGFGATAWWQREPLGLYAPPRGAPASFATSSRSASRKSSAPR